MDIKQFKTYFDRDLRERHSLLVHTMVYKTDGMKLSEFSINVNHNYYRKPDIARSLLNTGLNFLTIEGMDMFELEGDDRLQINVTKDTYNRLKRVSLLTNKPMSVLNTYYINVTLEILTKEV